MLRAAFTIRALTHAKDFLNVRWADGSQTHFPSMWLRSSVRDPTYFNQSSLIYRPEHLEFITRREPLLHAEQSEDKEHIKVTWSDHVTEFKTSWLRANDHETLPLTASSNDRQTLWDNQVKPPEYDFCDKESKFEEWFADLKKWGLILVKNAPINKQGLIDFLNMIGPLEQRIHPTDVFAMTSDFPKGEQVDFESYGKAAIPVHTDHSYYPIQAKIQAFLTEKYEAPKQDTINSFVDSFKILRDFQRENPATFDLIQSTHIRQGRRRMTAEEDCEPGTEHTYQWDLVVERPAISVEENQPKRFQFKMSRHAGVPLYANTAQVMPELYGGLRKIQEMADSPRYQYQSVLRPGTLVVFDNHRVLHGRSAIHPSTTRVVHGAFISEEIWRSRCRLIDSKRTCLEEKWLLGCSDQALDALAQLAEAN